MKKLKATDKIVVKSKYFNSGVLTFHKTIHGMYKSDEGIGVFNIQVTMDLNTIQRYIECNVFELVNGEWTEDEELKDVKTKEENNDEKVENNNGKNKEVDTSKLYDWCMNHVNPKEVEGIKKEQKEEINKKFEQLYKTFITGLEILNDIYTKTTNSEYYNCTVVDGDGIEYIIRNGFIMYNVTKNTLTQRGILKFSNTLFKVKKQETEIDLYTAIKTLINTSDTYTIYMQMEGKDRVEFTQELLVTVKELKTAKFYKIEK